MFCKQMHSVLSIPLHVHSVHTTNVCSCCKCCILHVEKLSKNFTFSINDADLPFRSTVKDLGVLINDSLGVVLDESIWEQCPHFQRIPFLPFPSILFHPFPLSPLCPIPFLTSIPLLRLEGLGECISSPSGSGQRPAAKRILVHCRHKFALFDCADDD